MRPVFHARAARRADIRNAAKRQTHATQTMASMTANVHAPPTAVACANTGLCSAPACAMANTVENSVVPAAPPNWSAC